MGLRGPAGAGAVRADDVRGGRDGERLDVGGGQGPAPVAEQVGRGGEQRVAGGLVDLCGGRPAEPPAASIGRTTVSTPSTAEVSLVSDQAATLPAAPPPCW